MRKIFCEKIKIPYFIDEKCTFRISLTKNELFCNKVLIVFSQIINDFVLTYL